MLFRSRKKEKRTSGDIENMPDDGVGDGLNHVGAPSDRGRDDDGRDGLDDGFNGE